MKRLSFLTFIITGLFWANLAAAASGQLSIYPAKVEVEVAPGKSVTKTINLKNETGRSLGFAIDVVDFEGSGDQKAPIKILSTASTSPYSVKKYISVRATDRKFNLANGEARDLPVTVTLPKDIPGGDRYAAVFFRGMEEGDGVQISTGLGALFFIRVPGPAFTEGKLKEFGVKLVDNKPSFDVLFENSGDVYLNPYGYVSVRNLFGREVLFEPIDPWFVMPHSLREMTVASKDKLFGGWYKATLKINRGYQNQVDTVNQSFFVFSWWFNLAAVILVVIVWWLVHKYTLWRRK